MHVHVSGIFPPQLWIKLWAGRPASVQKPRPTWDRQAIDEHLSIHISLISKESPCDLRT
jgi:hypothetical protein